MNHTALGLGLGLGMVMGLIRCRVLLGGLILRRDVPVKRAVRIAISFNKTVQPYNARSTFHTAPFSPLLYWYFEPGA